VNRIAIMCFKLTALALPVASVATACDLDHPTNSTCRVTSDSSSVVAEFPLSNVPFVWKWHRSSTPQNNLEFRWIAEFGSCSPEGTFVPGEYGFGASIYRFQGQTEVSGMLAGLLKEAQKDVTRRSTSGNGVNFAVVNGGLIDASLAEGRVVITARGTVALQALTRDHSPVAMLTFQSPDPDQSYSCVAKVEYK